MTTPHLPQTTERYIEDGLAVQPIPMSLLKKWVVRLLLFWVVGMGLGCYYGLDYIRKSDVLYEAELRLISVNMFFEGGGTSPEASALSILTGKSSSGDTTVNLISDLVGSAEMVKRLIVDHDIHSALVGARWNEASQTWVPSEAFPRNIVFAMREAAGREKWIVPSLREMSETLVGMLEIEEPTDASNLTVIRFQHPDKRFAAYFLGSVFTNLQEMVAIKRNQALEDAVSGLNALRDDTSLGISQRILTGIETGFIQRRLMSETNPTFGLLKFDDISVTNRPVAPSISRTLAIAVILGAVFSSIAGYFIWVVIDAVRSRIR